MPTEKPRLARLTTILTQLQSKRLVTATELADKHQVSVRTIYRDIRTLEKSGIPIVTEEGKGYSIIEGYKLPPVMFTEEEANALITAEQIISKNKDKSLASNYVNAIEKIKSVLKLSQQGKTELLSQRLHIRTNIEQEKTSDYLMELQSAITSYHLLELDYVSLQNKTSTRNVEPFALIQTQNNWILIGFCRLRKDFRMFRLDCIKKITNKNEAFEPHKLSLQDFFEEQSKQWKNTPDTPLS